MIPNGHRVHSEPASAGGVLPAIRKLHAHSVADRNVQVVFKDHRRKLAGGVEIRLMHWGKRAARMNDFHFILEHPADKHARFMTHEELYRPIGAWDDAEVALWRRGHEADSEHPPTLYEAARAAMSAEARIIFEAKHPLFRNPVVAAYAVHECKRAGHPPYFMALAGSMPYCRGKCKAIIQAGGQFLVIFGRKPLHRKWRPIFLATRRTWTVQPTAVSG